MLSVQKGDYRRKRAACPLVRLRNRVLKDPLVERSNARIQHTRNHKSGKERNLQCCSAKPQGESGARYAADVQFDDPGPYVLRSNGNLLLLVLVLSSAVLSEAVIVIDSR